MAELQIAICGAGHMGASLIGGLIKNGYHPTQLVACDLNPDQLSNLQQQFGLITTINLKDALANATTIIIAVKPQQCKELIKRMGGLIPVNRHPLIISIAAGIQTEQISAWLGRQLSIIRVMPNTPALIGCSASVLFANFAASTQDRNQASSILRAVGIIQWITDEKLMDIITALSGSGPAYFFMLMQAMIAAGVQHGLTPETAHQLVIQTALGSARLAGESSLSLQELIHNVTSPGGTTAQALKIFENNNFNQLVIDAITAAKSRAAELAEIDKTR